jgi:hypothetical protein
MNQGKIPTTIQTVTYTVHLRFAPEANLPTDDKNITVVTVALCPEIDLVK